MFRICVYLSTLYASLSLFFSPEQSFTLWDKWEVRGNKGFKLQDFLAAVKVSLLESLPSAKSEPVLYIVLVQNSMTFVAGLG